MYKGNKSILFVNLEHKLTYCSFMLIKIIEIPKMCIKKPQATSGVTINLIDSLSFLLKQN